MTTNNSRFLFTDGLALLLIAFKLAGIISWSWWYVLIPADLVFLNWLLANLIRAVKAVNED